MYIVTGGAGFIGSAFLAKLNSMGVERIIVVDNLGKSDKWKNLNGKIFLDYIHKNDFIEALYQNKFSTSIKAIIHMGACSSTTERDAEYMLRNNYLYTKSLSEWAISNKVRFIYASSAATYGKGENGYSDSHSKIPLLRPLNIYGFSKQLFDLWALKTGAISEITGIKFFNVFGPNEYHKGDMASVVYKAFNTIQQTGKVRLFKSHNPKYKDGEFVRDFIYIKDCVEVLWWFFENEGKTGIFNLGTGKARSWNDLASAIFKAMGKKEEIEYIDMPEEIRGQYQYHTEAEMEKLRQAGCAFAFSSLEDSIEDYVKNYLMAENCYI
ncbi:MAG: ADP-glyceromanno-heptose 6-epimerase [Candidatus Dadabacteria bacterium]|nr:MAG: ADP-glyceromanno-heptose 6-epimerase [Candidatus Dadabacteria bacterium]